MNDDIKPPKLESDPIVRAVADEIAKLLTPPDTTPPPPPDSVNVRISLVHTGVNSDGLAFLTLRWDSLPGADRYVATAGGPGGWTDIAVNDDSCPYCLDVGIQGHRWPCFEFQRGCRFNIWPYFQASWLASPGGTYQAWIRAFRADIEVGGSEVVAWNT